MNSKSQIAALILAAGSSSRMRGEDKLLRKIDGKSLLQQSVETILSSDVDQCFVVLNDLNSDRANACFSARSSQLDGLSVQLVEAKNAHEGMAVSIKAGVAALGKDVDGFMICLADMPEIKAQHLNKIIAAFKENKDAKIVRPIGPDGRYGHPVLFDACFKGELESLEGDQGARGLFKSHPDSIIYIELDDAIHIDLDTPEAWDAWEKSQR